jgi:hypothetical protein
VPINRPDSFDTSLARHAATHAARHLAALDSGLVDGDTLSTDVLLEAEIAWFNTGLATRAYTSHDVREIVTAVTTTVATVLAMTGWTPPAAGTSPPPRRPQEVLAEADQLDQRFIDELATWLHNRLGCTNTTSANETCDSCRPLAQRLAVHINRTIHRGLETPR